MKNKYLILDCFVDEPACFGVPPFISPYPRYIYGALVCANTSKENIKYYTIDKLRHNSYILDEHFDLVYLIGGAVVPGKYLGSRIGTAAEINKIINANSSVKFATGGLISQLLVGETANLYPVTNDIEKYAFEYASGFKKDSRRTTDEIKEWSVQGAEMVRLHPDFPNIICEIETSRGCPRQNHCSFCSEGLIKGIEFRDEEDILSEIDSLIDQGVSRFRIGRQADILQYKTKFTEFKNGFPRPQTEPLQNLFGELKKKKESGKITVLNIDNANPGTIVNFPDESSINLHSITEAITPGDTLPLGIESVDPDVISRNRLKVLPDEALEAVRIINSIGGKRIKGIPVLLPGINLIHGLAGETMNTYKLNYEWLLNIIDNNLLIKRINIRKLLPFPGTDLYKNPSIASKKIINRFEYYRDRIRHEIDTHMLKEIYPAGTILEKCHILDEHSGFSYGKQIASYSITAKVPASLKRGTFQDLITIGHRERSLIALQYPIEINKLSQKAIELIPGIGKKRSSEIIIKRPVKDLNQHRELFEGVRKEITESFRFD